MVPRRSRGWIVQNISISAVFADGQEHQYVWTEAWSVRAWRGRARDRIELGGEDAFLIPRGWIAGGAGSMDVLASAWFQEDLDARLARTPGKCGRSAWMISNVRPNGRDKCAVRRDFEEARSSSREGQLSKPSPGTRSATQATSGAASGARAARRALPMAFPC